MNLWSYFTHGHELIHHRWVDPPDGTYNLDYALKLGAQAKAAGLSVILNLHYSDDWADPGVKLITPSTAIQLTSTPGQQTKPAAWARLSTTDLIAKVTSYTTSVANAFYEAGITVNLIGIGNEIRAGMLWPDGKYDQMPTLAKLLTAASQGVRASKYGTNAKVMIHLDRGYDWGTQSWFYDSIISAGFDMADVDVQGVSYYPFWDATASTLENFQTNVDNMASKYGKALVVVETDWPIKCSAAANNIPASLTSAIPFSAAGQTTWVTKVAQILAEVPNGLGKGLMYWEPGWIDNASLGSPCEDGGTMFTGTWTGSKATAKARS